MYFLIGYTEEILSALLKTPVKMEIQTIENKDDVIFTYW
jgi:small subunit ribosomal protein S24